MALQIRKTYKDPTGGTETYVEGTEAEVEAYEKKQEKKRITQEQTAKKKRVLLGKGMVEADLRRIIREEIAAAPPKTVEHHWYNYNGWWWRPYVVGPLGSWTYQYTNTDPGLSTGQVYCTTNSAAELSSQIGMATNDVVSTTYAISGATSGDAFNGLVSNGNVTVGAVSVDELVGNNWSSALGAKS
jgi:hypothetical protein